MADAKLMTRKEAQDALWNSDIIWIEYKEAKCKMPVVAAIMLPDLGYWMDQNDDVIEVSDLDDDDECPYGKDYRFWTEKPDYLQRKAVEWDG